MNPTVQRPVSNSSIGELLLLIYKGDSVDEDKNSHRKLTMTHTQTISPNRIVLRTGKKGSRPAEVGALASVFEKSATELKLNKIHSNANTQYK